MAVMGPFLAVPGNFFFIFLSKRFRWSTKRILVVIIALYATIPVYGLIGYVAPFGMRTVAEIFVMGALYGFLIGPMLSFRRSFYADFIPPGSVRR